MDEKNKNIDKEIKEEKDTKEVENDSDVENSCEAENNDNVKSDADNSNDKVTELTNKLIDLEDKYKRLLAEFDNFRKRSEKESREMCNIGASIVLTKILPIVDNFERALKSLTKEIKENSFEEGIDKIYKQLIKTLEEMDVKPIEAVGKPFDPNLHNAVLTDETGDAATDTVIEELQKGYTYKDQVLRHSMVKVKK